MAETGMPPSNAQPITVTFPTARKLTGLGLTTLWKLAGEQRIETVRIGRRRLIIYRSLEALLAAPTERAMHFAQNPRLSEQ